MKILYVIPKTSNGGIESMVLSWIRFMQDHGYECDILAGNDGGNKDFEKMGCKVYYIELSMLSLFKTINRLKGFFKVHKDYDAVHGNVQFLNGAVDYAAKSYNTSILTVSHGHTNGNDHYSSILSKKINECIKSKCRKMIKHYSDINLACSSAAGEYLFGKDTNFSFFPNSIDTNLFKFNPEDRTRKRNELKIEHSFAILHIGRFSAEKNHIKLIGIFKSIVMRNPNAFLLLAGDGELKDEIKEIVNNDEMIRDKVAFLGFQKDAHILYSAADCFILPSKFEGFPVSMVEAQCNGLRCFVSDTIPKETQLSDLVSFCSLNTSDDLWAETVLGPMTISNREDYCDVIKRQGFDKELSGARLEALYLAGRDIC